MRSAIVLFCFGITAVASAQKRYGVEQNYYLHNKGLNGLVPSVYYETKKGLYGQLRYNYDDDQTAALYVGKTFGGERKLSWTLRPQLGILAGKFSGAGATLEADLEFGSFTFAARPQYCTSFNSAAGSCYYNWTEISFQPISCFYGGAAMQHTAVVGQRPLYEPGLLLGITIGKLDLPVYFFSPGKASASTVVSVCWKFKE